MSASRENMHRSKTDRLPQTCDICKLRHQKCNGARPSCHYCHLRDLQCNYSNTQAHKIDQSVVCRKSLASEAPPASPSKLSHRSSDVVIAQDYWVVHGILMTELQDLGLTSRRKEELSRAVAEQVVKRLAPSIQSHILHSIQGYAFEATVEYLVRILAQLWGKELGRDSRLILEAIAAENKKAQISPILPMPANPHTSPTRHLNLPSKDEAQRWLNTFLNGPNKLFCICAPLESQQLLDSLYDPEDEISRISKCLITFQLSVGCRFTEDTHEHVYTAIYENACLQMQDCIEEDDEMLLWIVSALLLNCIYSMNAKPKNCWITLGTAIRISQAHHIDREHERCRHLSDAEYSRCREVWRAIIFLDAWLAIDLGRLPQINENTTQDPFVRNIWADIRTSDQELGINMAKLAVLVSKFLVEVYAAKEVNLSTYENYLHTLEEWSSSLPESLRYFRDLSNSATRPGLSEEDESASLYLEVFYFATVLVLTRPLLLNVITMMRDRDASTIPLNLRFFAQTCKDSATQVGQVSSTMVKRGFICKRLWLVTTLNYHASLVLTLSLSMKDSTTRWNMTSAQEQSRRQFEKSGLDVSMSVLSYCAAKDSYANHFLKIIQIFKGFIEAQELSNFEQRADSALGLSHPDTMEPSTWFTPKSVPLSETASFGSFPHPSTTLSSTSSPLDLRMNPIASNNMSGSGFVDLTNSWDQSSIASPLLPESLADPNSLYLNWGELSPASFAENMEIDTGGQPGQMRLAPQHFQTFLPGFSQSQDFHTQK